MKTSRACEQKKKNRKNDTNDKSINFLFDSDFSERFYFLSFRRSSGNAHKTKITSDFDWPPLVLNFKMNRTFELLADP